MSTLTAKRRLVSAVLLLLPAVFSVSLSAQSASLTAAQIVERMTEASQQRAAHLPHTTSLRHYHVEYNGVMHLAADMDVEAIYDARAGKSFRVVRESGSHMLCEKVLRRAVESEREAAQDRKATALTPANYRFTLAGEEPVNGRSAYRLDVEPITSSKFLLRGRIWVDEADFAVARIDASPAKNPSFWISRTLIEQSFVHSGEFWLPARNRSETHVRVGGTAVLTVDYGSDQFQPATAFAAEARPR